MTSTSGSGGLLRRLIAVSVAVRFGVLDFTVTTMPPAR